MNPSKPTFGQRGVPANKRRAANPYTGGRVPLGGVGTMGHLGSVDENLRAFMLSVYNYMGLGLLVTGFMALLTYFLTVTTDPAQAARWADDGTLMMITQTEYLTSIGGLLWTTPLSFAVCFGPLAIILFTCGMWRNMAPGPALGVFLAIATLIGISFSGLALTYTNGSIAQMFFATAAGFGGLSLFGYTTRKDLSGWGSFLWMGLFGLIGAFVINMFMPTDGLTFAISVVGVIVFSGFTAYDTQMIKEAYTDKMSSSEAQSLAIQGALDLYLDFINLFRFLLALFGQEE